MTRRRTAVVTGATRGIGLAVARALAPQHTVIMIARNADDLRAAARDIGDSACALACDLADAAATNAAIDRIGTMTDGAPDLLVNNAGLFKLSPIESTSPEAFSASLELNLSAPFRLIRAFLPEMRKRASGHIVSIGSIADHMAFPENGSYSAAKFGLRGLHGVLRAELAGTGVRSTLISPAPVDTPLWDEVNPDERPGFTPRSAMLRPEDVAAAVLFVVSQPASVNVDELRLSRS
ncbi:MAG TPA: SDR family oxidoreductase [Gemmatimonadaceae bacterium]|jgi:NADP-dependent 3-hydroxy acid dehydrogenase YdfG|nr:SDR family oxidoreductase [Gemmatimonadaceae bacterium]